MKSYTELIKSHKHYSAYNTVFLCCVIQFVAHPNVQQLLAAIWYDGLPGFRRKSMIGQMVEVGKLGAMFAMYGSMYMLNPDSKMGQLMKKPFIKFVCHSSSYAFFLSKLNVRCCNNRLIPVDQGYRTSWYPRATFFFSF